MTIPEQKLRTVGDFMTGDLIALRPIDSVARARQVLADTSLHALPILDQDRAVGVVTLADCTGRFGAGLLGDVVARPPVTIGAGASVAAAAALMRNEGIHHLLVTEDSPGATEVVGILSSFDLLKAITD
ncbi:MAG: CBS domain-containing protein [Acidimicrobiales bacterium]